MDAEPTPEHPQPLESAPETIGRLIDRAKDNAGSDGLEIIACTDIGCWSVSRESWQEFLERKRLPSETRLDFE